MKSYYVILYWFYILFFMALNYDIKILYQNRNILTEYLNLISITESKIIANMKNSIVAKLNKIIVS